MKRTTRKIIRMRMQRKAKIWVLAQVRIRILTIEISKLYLSTELLRLLALNITPNFQMMGMEWDIIKCHFQTKMMKIYDGY